LNLNQKTLALALIFVVTIPTMFLVPDIIALTIIFYVANFATCFMIISLLFVPKVYFILQNIFFSTGTRIRRMTRVVKDIELPATTTTPTTETLAQPEF
jgi:hypothetical protein